MVDFNDILHLKYEGRKVEKKDIASEGNQVIDRQTTCENTYSKNEMLVFQKYGLTPEEILLIEEQLHIGIEKAKPRKLDEKEDKNLGLDSRVIKFIELMMEKNNNDLFIQ